MAYALLALAVVAAIGIVVGAVIGAGLGGLLLALIFLAMVFMAVLTPTTRVHRLTGREPAPWSAGKPPSRRDDEPVE